MRVLSIVATSVLAIGLSATSVQAESLMGMAEGGVFDINQDGKISEEEFMKMNAAMAKKEFAVMDVNDDGNVTADEFKFFMTNR